jgi:flagellar hook-basal body complex protein FliE
MDASSLNATLAYRNQLKLLQQTQEAGPETAATAGPSFAQMVGESLKESADTLRATDAVQMQSVTGKVDLTDLVTAVTNAELTLNTVVTVRDRVINAYQEILRMSI